MRRTTVTKARWTAGAVAGAVLAVGCGGGGVASSSPPAATASPSFGQQAVRGDLDAAIADAGLPAGRTAAGVSSPDGRSAGPGTTEKERKLLALGARLSPCTVSWTSAGPSDSPAEAADPAETRHRLDVVLTGLAARGWKRTGPSEEVPAGEGGTYFTAVYKKRGWTLHARHNSLGTWSQSAATVTQDACFARLTDEERALMTGAG
jgi:hypothetical protein